jgi:hypothetical protein
MHLMQLFRLTEKPTGWKHWNILFCKLWAANPNRDVHIIIPIGVARKFKAPVILCSVVSSVLTQEPESGIFHLLANLRQLMIGWFVGQ